MAESVITILTTFMFIFWLKNSYLGQRHFPEKSGLIFAKKEGVINEGYCFQGSIGFTFLVYSFPAKSITPQQLLLRF